MGVFGNKNTEPVYEAESCVSELIIAELMFQLGPEGFENFCESAEAEALCEAGIIVKEALIGKKTLIRLNKFDDLSRRTKMAAIQLAKEKRLPEYDKLEQLYEKKRKLEEDIMRRTGIEAEREAKKAQREFMKVPSLKSLPGLQSAEKDDK